MVYKVYIKLKCEYAYIKNKSEIKLYIFQINTLKYFFGFNILVSISQSHSICFLLLEYIRVQLDASLYPSRIGQWSNKDAVSYSIVFEMAIHLFNQFIISSFFMLVGFNPKIKISDQYTYKFLNSTFENIVCG